MPEQKSLNQRDSKLVQWLNEAHTKEAELEADLTAHIALTDKQSYKKRLRQHLTETKAHKRSVAARIKQLGGSASASPTLPGVPSAVGEAAGKAVAAVKGQVGAARAAVTSQPETHLRNAQEELREEHVEIAIYSRIATFAEAVGDRETARPRDRKVDTARGGADGEVPRRRARAPGEGRGARRGPTQPADHDYAQGTQQLAVGYRHPGLQPLTRVGGSRLGHA